MVTYLDTVIVHLGVSVTLFLLEKKYYYQHHHRRRRGIFRIHLAHTTIILHTRHRFLYLRLQLVIDKFTSPGNAQ